MIELPVASLIECYQISWMIYLGKGGILWEASHAANMADIDMTVVAASQACPWTDVNAARKASNLGMKGGSTELFAKLTERPEPEFLKAAQAADCT